MKSPGNREGWTTHLERIVNELQVNVARQSYKTVFNLLSDIIYNNVDGGS